MARVSTRKMDEGMWERIWGQLVNTIKTVNNYDYAQWLLSGLLTRTEKIILAKRLMVGILFTAGWKAYDIADVLKLSVASVYKYQEFLYFNKEYKQLLRNFLFVKDKTKKQLLRDENPFLRELSELVDIVFTSYRNRSRSKY